jgi:uncharacterized protein (DUF58 family)
VLLPIGLLKGINLVTLLASMLLVLVLWNWWEARRQVRRVTAQRLDDEPAFAKTPYRWGVRLKNTGRRAAGGIEVFDGHGADRPSQFVAELRTGQTVDLHGEITYERRGRVEYGALTIRSGHPLGLASVRRLAEPAGSLIVLPRLGRLHRAQLQRYMSRRSASLGQSRGVPCHAPTAQAEFYGLRPYRPGDSLRHLHWRTTARRGELMVREYEEWPNDDLTLVLEARKGPRDADGPLLEQAISLAATICWEWCRQTGDRLLLAVAGAEVTMQEGATAHALARVMLERLAIEPGAEEVDTDRLIALLRARKLSAGPIVYVSPRPSVIAAQLQFSLRRRNIPVAISSGDAAGFFEWDD